MTYKLYIDDLRSPPNDDWVIARSSAKAISVIKSLGFPKEISFDHDLGEDDTAMKVAKWIVNTDSEWCTYQENAVHAINVLGKRRGEKGY